MRIIGLLLFALVLKISTVFAEPIIAVGNIYNGSNNDHLGNFAFLSFDNGNTWTTNSDLTSKPLVKSTTTYCNQSTCFVAGNNYKSLVGALPVLMKLSNNKQNWSNVIPTIPSKYEGSIKSVNCGNTNYCLALLDPRKSFNDPNDNLLMSYDGENWNTLKGIPTLDSYMSFNNLTCNKQYCLLSGEHPARDNDGTYYFILYSQVGEDKWQPAKIENATTALNLRIDQISCNGKVCISNAAVDDKRRSSSVMLISYDSGRTWKQAQINGQNTYDDIRHKELICTDANTCIAAGAVNYFDSGELLFSENSGETWDHLKKNPIKGKYKYYSSVACLENTCFLTLAKFYPSAGSPLLMSTDAGRTWFDVKNLPVNADALSLQKVACNSTQCYAMGNIQRNAIMLTTKDKGMSWQKVTLPALPKFSSNDVIYPVFNGFSF